jgi:hypothetical protein
MIVNEIINVANGILGIKEIPPNRGFDNKEFEKEMKALCGWRAGQAWCAYTAEYVWRKAYTNVYGDVYDNILKRLFSANSQQTYKNFSQSEMFMTGNEPKLGALVIWKHKGISGHTAAAVIHINYHNETYVTIEGNKGDMIKEVTHKFNENNRMGFVYPIEPK